MSSPDLTPEQREIAVILCDPDMTDEYPCAACCGRAPAVARMLADARVEVCRETAEAWQHGPAQLIRPMPVEFTTGWLRARADRYAPDSRES